jgi:hypothetical protein
MTQPTVTDRLSDLLHKRWVQVVIGLFVVFCLFIGWTYSRFNGIRHKGVEYETQLSAQYSDAQNELGSYISTFYEQFNIASAKADKLNTVLADAIKGRYDKTGLTPAAPGQTQGNQLISAMVEAYPDLSGLNSFDRILDTISAGRTAYKNKQTALLDRLRSYDNWRNQDIIGSWLINIAGFPSHSLRAQVGQQFVTGTAAEDQMYVIVLPSDANQAYTSGTLEPLTVPSPSSSGK